MSIALLFGVYRGNMLFFLAVVFFSIPLIPQHYNLTLFISS